VVPDLDDLDDLGTFLESEHRPSLASSLLEDLGFNIFLENYQEQVGTHLFIAIFLKLNLMEHFWKYLRKNGHA